ncbi:ParB/RepB/Spo0J family partition protein [bacterium]|jgi:ParB family transcriptional regulator, chromosome partitioning protein|nr:ParB/RepB/Spo0J family partition protein [Saprospiraceae bacterium]MDA9301343.1 ParB/RepB/Spo0J family partition protein [bacterium]HAW03102.1 chromosome partitioning protein ParB [Saprospirales bacterium]
MAKKKELSRGIRALLSNIEDKTSLPQTKEIVKELSSSIAEISLEDIEINPFQPRTEFDPEELVNLAKSIKTYGLIQPITVRSLGGNKFQLISGERRLRASKMAGLNAVPAYIRIADDQGMLEMALVENIQRSELNAVEVAISYQRLIDECKLTHEELSGRVGKNRSTITNYIRLLKLPPVIQAGVKKDQISMGHARALAGVDNVSLQLTYFHRTVENKLSVRALEQLIRGGGSSNQVSSTSSNTHSGNSLPSEVVAIRDELRDQFGSKVEIKRDTKGKGQFVIKFNNDMDFNRILEILQED